MVSVRCVDGMVSTRIPPVHYTVVPVIHQKLLDITNIKVPFSTCNLVHIKHKLGDSMNFKSDLSLRHSVLAVSRNFKPQGESKKLTIIVKVGDHLFDMANNFFQSNFALQFQEIKIPSLLGRSVGNKVGMRVDTQRGERAARRGILVDTEPGAQSTYSVELGNEDTSRSKVENPLAHLVVRRLARRV